jgi:uncharacterized protein
MGTITDYLNYEQMVENALRNVVRHSLEQVAAHGFSGEHHFYITFKTNHQGVVIPPYLREKYPQEMTIVLQYQFYNLNITLERFEVSLSFNNVLEDLVIPFAAITGFADPSVKFGLQFHHDLDLEDGAPEILSIAALEHADKDSDMDSSAEVISLDTFRKKK